eukprot:TRINITY_DN29478_c0_g1_i1.p1 TRINITY_DN29478_c0_g1~~TRINITY_DN29478_c0_g1_i1.p1  ORF type:complete len:734 (-),score=113.07 TRINITY_DN29478_c0_g1_i1:937-3138(-)
MATAASLLNPIVWTPDYAVNIPLIDEQHKVLFQIMDNLRLAILEHREKSDVAQVMKGLVDYCIHHFHAEEGIMDAVGYPTQQSHAAVHRQFEEKCLGWAEDFWKDNLQPIVMLEFLEKWLVTHILHNDKKLAAFMEIHKIDLDAFVDETLPVRHSSRAGCGAIYWKISAQWHALILYLQAHFALVLLATGFVCTLGVLVVVVVPENNNRLSRTGRAVVVAILAGIAGATAMYLWWKIRLLGLSEAESKMLVTRQVSDALLASQIAEKIATMDLDMEILFTNADADSPLLTALKSIVDNLVLIRPHIPSAVFALIRRESEEEDEEEDQDLPQITFKNRGNSQRRARPSVPGAVRDHANSVIEIGSPLMMPTTAGTKQSHLSRDSLYHLQGSNAVARQADAASIVSSSHAQASVSQNKMHLARSLKRTIVTCFAVDLADFHRFIRDTPGEVTLAVHSDYVSAVKSCTENNRGVIHSMNGDRAICSWNACKPAGNHAVLACQAALQLQIRVQEINFKHNVNLRLNIGIASGKAYVGVMGCETKSDFAIVSVVMHSCVALAKLNRHMDTMILMDTDTWIDSSSHCQCEAIASCEADDNPALPNEPSLIYELKRLRQHNDNGEWMYTLQNAEDQDPLREYNTAIADFCQGRWSQCGARLQSFLQKEPTHARAQTLFQRCQILGATSSSSGATEPPPAPCKFGWYALDSYTAKPPMPFSPNAAVAFSPGARLQATFLTH